MQIICMEEDEIMNKVGILLRVITAVHVQVEFLYIIALSLFQLSIVYKV